MILNWTEPALGDLSEIEKYISRNSQQYGLVVLGRIFDRAKLLTEFPQLGATVPEYADNSLRELLVKPYRIVYRIFPERIDVLAVVQLSTSDARGSVIVLDRNVCLPEMCSSLDRPSQFPLAHRAYN
ncbi:type II toxin-antitoxin system RelE/ParE family toxin [soil metagenome]